MLPTYHGGSMSGHGSKPLRRPWVPDLSGTLIAIIVLAVVLAFEHFHFQSRLARVSTLEVSLAKQLQELQGSLTQQDEQLHRMNPKLDEIDAAESSLKRLQDEVRRSSTGLQDVKTALDQLQSANATAELKEATSLHGKQLEGLTAQLEALRAAQTASNATMVALDSRVAELEANLTKLAAKLDSHNSALKTLADQLSVHQNSTLSALQQQTAAVSEALEAHRELQNSVEKLKELRTGAAGPATNGTAGVSVTAGTNQSSAAVNATSDSAAVNATSDSAAADAAGGTVAAANSMEAAIRAAISGGAVDGGATGAATAGTALVDRVAAVSGTSASTIGTSAEDDHLTRGRNGLVLDDEEGRDAVASVGGTTAAAGSTAENTTTAANATTVANVTVEGTASNSSAAGDAGTASSQQAAAGDAAATTAEGTGDSTSALDALRALVVSTSDTEEEEDATGTDSTGLASITGTTDGGGEGASTDGIFAAGVGDDAVARIRGKGGYNQQQGFQAGAGRGRFERMHEQFTKQQQQQQATGGADGDGGADAAAAAAGGEYNEEQEGEEGVLVDEEEQDVVEGLRR